MEPFEWAREGGAVAIVLLILWAILRGWLHTDGEFKEMKEDRNLWRSIALKGVNAAEQATDYLAGQVSKRDDPGGSL